MYHNFTADELIRMAEAEDNALAIAVGETVLSEAKDAQDADYQELEELVDDAVDYFTDKVDAAIKAHIDTRYRDTGLSTFPGDVEYCVCNDYQLDKWFDHVLKEVEFWERPLGIVEEAEAFYVELAKSRDPEVIERLDTKLDGEWCSATDVTHYAGYFAHDSASIATYVIGEIELEVKAWMDSCEVPESLRERVLKGLDQATWNEGSDFMYVDLSDEHLSWTMRLEWLEEFYQEELEGAANLKWLEEQEGAA